MCGEKPFSSPCLSNVRQLASVRGGSDSNESAEREIALWFGGDENLMDWEPTITPWVRE